MTLPTGLVTDFDFLTGSWHVVNRRLKHRLVGSNDWDEFDALSTCEPRLGGVGNVEQIDCPERGFSGMTIRLFDLAQSRWSIYWANSTVGRLEPPVCGGFDGNVARPASPTEASALGQRLTKQTGAQLHMLLTSLHAVNDFPALVIREGENVVVAVLTGVGDVLDRPEWDAGVAVFGGVLKSSQVFCLRPTDLSRLR